MSITLSDAKTTIEANGFSQGTVTSKVIEYTSARNGLILYLRVAQGFPIHADIALHPEVDLSNLTPIADLAPHKNVFRYSSNMSKFQERVNTGKGPENYGKAFHARSVEALAKVCMVYGA